MVSPDEKFRARQVERAIGSKVREARLLANMSQEKLGNALGVTFQQIQKYENGSNRISASRLKTMSSILGVDILFLLDTEQAEEAKGSLHSKNELKILRAIRQIEDATILERMINLLSVLAAEAKTKASS